MCGFGNSEILGLCGKRNDSPAGLTRTQPNVVCNFQVEEVTHSVREKVGVRDRRDKLSPVCTILKSG